MSKLHTSIVTKWIYGIVRISLFWSILNLPYIFLIGNGYFVENRNETGTLMITGLILIPFILCPGWTAVFSATRKFLVVGNDFQIREVFRESYVKNYKMSMKIGIVYNLLVLILYANYILYQSLGGIVESIFLIVLFLTFFFLLFILTYLADRQEKLFDYFLKGFHLVSRHPILLFFSIVESGLIIYFCHFIGLLLIMVVPGLVSLITNYFFNQIVKLESAATV